MKTTLNLASLVFAILIFQACSKHNPEHGLNPNSNSYIGDECLESGRYYTDKDGKIVCCSEGDPNCGSSSSMIQTNSSSSQTSNPPQSSSDMERSSSVSNPISSSVYSSEAQASSAASSSSTQPVTYTLTVAGGTIEGETELTQAYPLFKKITVIFDINALSQNQCFDGWSIQGKGGLDTTKSTLTFYMPSRDVSVEAKISSCEGVVMDVRDGKRYQQETFTHTWLPNLRYEMAGSFCDPNANCDSTGYLYTLDAAKTACPAGWRLPTIEELMADTSSLNLILGGNHTSNGTFEQLGQMGFYWTSSAITDNRCTDASSCGMALILSGNNLYTQSDDKGLGFSVRCIQDY